MAVMQNLADTRRARTWAEVDLAQAERNAVTLRRLVGPAEVMAVVKADAYGHGAASLAGAFARAGITRFGVASLAEALALRQAGVGHDIHVLSPFLPEEADALVRADVIPMVSSGDQWWSLVRAARDAPLPARCFLKVDTGMGRSGCLPDEARALWATAREAPQVRVTGIATHFSSADEPDPAPSEAQAKAFHAFLRSLDGLSEPQEDGRGEHGVWLSSANSPATLRFPLGETGPGVRGVLVRAGLLLYGIEPFRGALDGTGLEPVLSWKARVTLLRDLPAGATVGYGRTHTLARPSRVATLAAGYADGLSRRLSNNGDVVLLRGRRLPLLGRVSMDQCQVDVTDAPEVEVGDIATLIGTDGGETQTVLDLAERIDTTPHEPTCALSNRVARIYTPLPPV